MLRNEMSFDPTDANASSKIAEACIPVMKVAARAIWAYNHKLSMGRDDSADLTVKINELAHALGFLPWHATGAEIEAFWEKLLAEAGITAEPLPREEPRK